MAGLVVPFYFGVGSRYSYLAATQLEAMEERTGCTFEWLPLNSAELIRRANDGASPFVGSAPSGQYDWKFRQQDAEAWASYYGVSYREPAEPGREVSDFGHACWIADEHGKLKDMCWQLFKAKFVEPRDQSRAGIRQMANEIGLDGGALIDRLDAPEIAAKHERVLSQALAAGVFGAPTFVVNEQLLWGNDRLVLVEHALRTSD